MVIRIKDIKLGLYGLGLCGILLGAKTLHQYFTYQLCTKSAIIYMISAFLLLIAFVLGWIGIKLELKAQRRERIWKQKQERGRRYSATCSESYSRPGNTKDWNFSCTNLKASSRESKRNTPQDMTELFPAQDLQILKW